MTTRQWFLVAAALGIGILAQIPMNHAMDTSQTDGHELPPRDHAAASSMAEVPNGLAQVTFTITGMT